MTRKKDYDWNGFIVTSKTLQVTSINLEIQKKIVKLLRKIYFAICILQFRKSNLSGTMINSQTFFGKKPKELNKASVYKAKGTTWPSRLKYIPGSVLTETFETIVLTSNTIIYLTLCESIQISSWKWWL